MDFIELTLPGAANPRARIEYLSIAGAQPDAPLMVFFA